MKNRPILAYALGGGLGHCSRVLRLHAQQCPDRPITILLSPHLQQWGSRFYSCKRPHIHWVYLPNQWAKSPEKVAKWFDRQVDTYQPEEIWIDTFPQGIFAELNLAEQLPSVFLARLLKKPDAGFASLKISANFDRVLLAEPVSDAQLDYLSTLSTNPIQTVDWRLSAAAPAKLPARSYSVLTHSGNQQEVDQLVAMNDDDNNSGRHQLMAAVADDIDLPSGCERIDNAQPYYAGAKVIYSGAGFNTILETRNFRYKQSVIPFARRFDDQKLRCQINGLQV